MLLIYKGKAKRFRRNFLDIFQHPHPVYKLGSSYINDSLQKCKDNGIIIDNQPIKKYERSNNRRQ